MSEVERVLLEGLLDAYVFDFFDASMHIHTYIDESTGSLESDTRVPGWLPLS
jgi:hypothetical protein